jgi:hypothetical protein
MSEGTPNGPKSEVGGPKSEEVKAERIKVKGALKTEVRSPKSEVGSKESEESNYALKELPTANSKLQTEQMEVHHHPQLEHKPKPWKEYLLEGLMIFLAVTMGFFAESLREHISNAEREEQYVHSLVDDLKDDTTRIAMYIRVQKRSRDQLDSLIAILNDPANISKHSNEVYYFGRLGPRLQNVAVNMRTIDQLKNSGSFRLISNMKVSNSIMAYYERVPLVRQIEGLYAEEFTSYKKVAANIFEPAIFRRQEGEADSVIRSTDNPPLQKNASAFVKELAINTVYMNGSRKGVLAADEDLLKNAKELLSTLKKEYHLEDE